MDLSNILSVGISALVLTVLIHVTVFYVVRTLYPPVRKVTFAEPAPPPPPPVVFTEAPNTDKQNAVVPTYEANVPSETPRQEGATTIEDLSLLTTTTG